MNRNDVERHRLASSLGVILVFMASVFGLGWLWAVAQGSSAAFADREVFDGNHLGTGTVDIAVGAATARLTAQDMAAGDTAGGRLEVVNDGTLPLRYSLSVSSDSATFDEVFELVAWDAAGGCSETPPAGTDPWAVDRSGTATIGALGPGDAHLVCLSGTLALSAPTSLQGRRVELTVVVLAEHDLEATP